MPHASALPHPAFMDDEGLRDLPITPLVVGDSRALVLGRPVALGHAAPPVPALRADAASRKAALASPARWPWQWQALLAAAAAAAVVAGVVLAGCALQSTSGVAGGLPVHPAAFSAPAVRVVATAYVPPPSLASADLSMNSVDVPPADADAAMPPLPISPRHTVAPPAPAGRRSAPPVRRPPALPKREAIPSASKPQVPAQEQSQAEHSAPRALVLDEADPRAPGDPRTRLPQQFQVGDALPGGDTIRAIDGLQGKVFTSGKEYGLD